MFSDSDKPRISQNWRIRNDGINTILYLHSLQTHVSRVLSPFEALYILLFDGANTWTEIKSAARQMVDGPEESIDRHIEQLTKALSELPGLFALEGPASPSLDKPLEHLLPDMAGYSMTPYRMQRPITVTIAYTNRCQCDCIYCYAEREDSDERSLAEWIPILDELSANEITLVDIGGADIFCRKDALDIMGEMAARNFSFFVSTKGYVSPDRARRLAALNVGNKSLPHWALRPLQISIDSTDHDKAAMLTRQRRYFSHAEKSVRNVLDAGMSPRVKAVLTPENAEQPLRIVRHFAPMGVDEFHFVQYSRGLYRHDDRFFLDRSQKDALVYMEQRIKEEFPDVFVSMQKDMTTGGPRNVAPEVWSKRPTCSGGRTKMLIKPNGDVSLCEQIPAMPEFLVGNVFEKGVMGVWNSEAIRRFNYPPRERFQGTVCYDCGDFEHCHEEKGWCFRDSLACYGTMYDAPPDCPQQWKLPPRAV